MEFDRSDLTERQKKLFEISKFLGILLLMAIPFQLFLYMKPDTSGIQNFHAALITPLLQLIGFDAVHNGTDIVIGKQIYRVTQDCLGWKSMTAFTALVIATDQDLRKHSRFLIAGIAGLFIANIVRILTTVILSEWNIISYEIIHGVLWKWGLTAIVFALWIFWYRNGQFKLDRER